jgi:hypothetical protein
MSLSNSKRTDDVGNKVVGALDALSLTPNGEDDVDMDLDANVVEGDGHGEMDAHVARGKMKQCSIQVAMLTREKMALTGRLEGLGPEEALTVKEAIKKLTSEVDDAKDRMNEWLQMLDDLESAERSMGRTAPSNVVASEGSEQT